MDPTIIMAGLLWLNPPPPEPVTLEKALAFETDYTYCEFSDGFIKLEVSPRQIVKDGYDAKMRCEHLRCLVESGETCW